MTAATEETNRAMLRVRDAVDRGYASELDLAALARIAHLSPDHLIRTFRSVFGETPHRYLQRRRLERAMFLLRTTDDDVLTICLAVGFSSLGSFGRLFSAVVGETPTAYREGGPAPVTAGCFTMAWMRPASYAEPRRPEDRLTTTSISEKRPTPRAG